MTSITLTNEIIYIILTALGAAVGALISATIWAIKADANIKSQAKEIVWLQGEIKDIKLSFTNLDTKILDRLSKMEQALAKIEGYMMLKDGQ